jgi:DNA-directed RNA polymerase specialized sigma24 family protein
MVRLSMRQKVEIYKDILIKSDMAIKRHGLYWLDKQDIANEIWLQFINKHKMRKYDPAKGANPKTFACCVCGNLIKNHLRRVGMERDDTKRMISDTITSKTNIYFFNIAKEYQIEDSEPETSEESV